MLKLTFKPLDIETIKSIAEWKYNQSDEGLYMEPYLDSYLLNPKMLKGPGGCDGYSVHLDKKLFGLFEYKFVNHELEIGCALEPSVKGKGYGPEFVTAGIRFGVSEYQYTGGRVLLNVNVTNLPARRVYKKSGFIVENMTGNNIRMYKDL